MSASKKLNAKRVRGRIAAEISVLTSAGVKESKVFVFEMSSDGVLVRKKKSRKTTARLWSFAQLANGAGSNNQMVLL